VVDSDGIGQAGRWQVRCSTDQGSVARQPDGEPAPDPGVYPPCGPSASAH